MAHKSLAEATRYWASWSKDRRLAALAKQSADYIEILQAQIRAAGLEPPPDGQ